MKKLEDRKCIRCNGSGNTKWGKCYNCSGTGVAIEISLDVTKTLEKLILTHKGTHPKANKANWERMKEIVRNTIPTWEEKKRVTYDKGRSISSTKKEEKMVIVFKKPQQKEKTAT